MPARHFNIADLFEIVADAVPGREALVCGAARLSYADLDRRANRLAHYLEAQGIGAGDKVGLYLHNCNEYLEGMLACFKICAVPVNVNFRYVDEELVHVFGNSDMVGCIHHREFVPHIAAVRGAVPRLRVLVSVDDDTGFDPDSIGAASYENAVASGAETRGFAERSDDDLFLLYTGGTTGMPKGVMWPHKAVFFAAMGGGGHFHPAGPITAPAEIAVRAQEGFVVIGLPLAPLMHGACWWYACIQLLAGSKVVLNPAHSLIAEDVWDLVERERVNAISIVGDAMAIPLLDALERNPGRWDLGCIFNVGSGGAVFSESKQARFREHFPNVLITNSFGSSEGGQMGMDNGQRRSDAENGLGNVSRTPYMDVIVEEQRRHARPGESGIFARSGHIPIGYYNDAEKTARTFVEVEGRRWLLTGDAARLEPDGSITVFGRGSNCINSGGEKIFPEEVEQALKNHPDVFDALVVGTPDERWGQKATAVVSVRDGRWPTLEELQNAARVHIAGYKLPRDLHIIAEIPRQPSGKPNYVRAREIALAGAHRAP
ncbi:MAG: acyl-CoA synthetase [Pseudomonadales bacterium]|nr:acyl-CoA synthetase [Pseudomonadales bacterium]MCP5320898.1 acyl-CoA synthetase [Pseudomonadales bacterium]MCP5338317.1 acyl-CoA synthetase [Pseudomonadales bacterium]